MVRADEEARAVEYRRKENRLARVRLALNRALQGNEASAKAVRDGFEPIVLARLEERMIEGDEER